MMKNKSSLDGLIVEGDDSNQGFKILDYIFETDYSYFYNAKLDNDSKTYIAKVYNFDDNTHEVYNNKILGEERNQKLFTEKVYNANYIPIAPMYSSAVVDDDNYLVMIFDKYKFNLQSVIDKIKLPPVTSFHIGLKMLEAFYYMASLKMVYYNLKPRHIMFDEKNRVFLIDQLYSEKLDKKKRFNAEDVDLFFSSVDSMNGKMSFKSCLEELLYNMVFWTTKHLPWEGMTDRDEIITMKKECLIDPSLFFKTHVEMPSEFYEFTSYIQELSTKTVLFKPNYNHLISIFKNVIKNVNDQDEISFPNIIKTMAKVVKAKKEVSKLVLNKTLCEDFERNPGVNPISGRKLQIGKKMYNDIKKDCEEILKDKRVEMQPSEMHQASLHRISQSIKPKTKTPSSKSKITLEQCDELEKNPGVNPITNRKIQVGKKTYNELKADCEELENQDRSQISSPKKNLTKPSSYISVSSPKSIKEEKPKKRMTLQQCYEFLNNPGVNPLTNRKIQIGKKAHLDLEKECKEMIAIEKALSSRPNEEDEEVQAEIVKSPRQKKSLDKVKSLGLTEDQCENFKNNPDINPVTNRRINLKSKKYNEIKEECEEKDIFYPKTQSRALHKTVEEEEDILIPARFLKKEKSRASKQALSPSRSGSNILSQSSKKSPTSNFRSPTLEREDKISVSSPSRRRSQTPERKVETPTSKSKTRQRSKTPERKVESSRKKPQTPQKVPLKRQKSQTPPHPRQRSKTPERKVESPRRRPKSPSPIRVPIKSKSKTRRESPSSHPRDLISSNKNQDIRKSEIPEAQLNMISINGKTFIESTIHKNRLEELSEKVDKLGYILIDVPNNNGACMLGSIGSFFGMSEADLKEYLMEYIKKCEHLKSDFIRFNRSYLNDLEKGESLCNESVVLISMALDCTIRIFNDETEQFIEVGTNKTRIVTLGYLHYPVHYVYLIKKNQKQPIYTIPTNVTCNVSRNVDPKTTVPVITNVNSSEEINDIVNRLDNIRNKARVDTLMESEKAMLKTIGLI